MTRAEGMQAAGGNAGGETRGETPRRVRVGDVCELARGEAPTVGASGGGPYTLYGQDCRPSTTEDYQFEAGGTVLVPAMGQVLSAADGSLIVRVEPGRCSCARAVHALTPHDRREAAYVGMCLSTSPHAARFAVGSPQLRELSAPALLSSPLPWPGPDARAAFVRALEELDCRARSLEALGRALYARGDRAYARMLSGSGDAVRRRPVGELCTLRRGTDVPAALRAADLPVRVEEPIGALGRCEEQLAGPGALVVGPRARTLLAHIVCEASHPLAETAYVVRDESDVELPVLLFALRAAGVRDRILHGAEAESAPAAPRVPVAELAQVEVPLGEGEALAETAPVLEAVVGCLCALDREQQMVARQRARVIREQLALMPVTVGKDAAERDAAEQGAAAAAELRAASAVVSSRLGPLDAALQVALDAGVAAPDAAWEVAPLAVLRACLTPAEWDALLAACGPEADPAGVVPAVDAALSALAGRDDLLSFLPNLSYATSLLASGDIAACVCALGEVPADDVLPVSVRALFQGPGAGEGLPAAVLSLMEEAALACAPDPELVYVPVDAAGQATDMAARLFPLATLRVQTGSFEEALEASLVRAVACRHAGEQRGGMGAAAASALTDDQFPDFAAPLVVAHLPANDAAWTDARPDAEDPRWVLGVPPRNRSGFAWVQQALCHLAEDGDAVLLMEDAPLRSTRGSDPILRKELVAQRRVRCVVSLPAGILPDGGPSCSLVVLGGRGCSDDILFVSLLGCELALPGGSSGPRRVVAGNALARARQALSSWLRGEAVEQRAGSARVVAAAQVEVGGCSLVAWDHA